MVDVLHVMCVMEGIHTSVSEQCIHKTISTNQTPYRVKIKRKRAEPGPGMRERRSAEETRLLQTPVSRPALRALPLALRPGAGLPARVESTIRQNERQSNILIKTAVTVFPPDGDARIASSLRII